MGRAFEFRKGRKMKRWASMSKAFTRITKDVIMAVKEAGPNPESNYRLKMLMQNAKAANMPKENIERAIKKATSKDQTDYKEVIYEGYAPHGIAVLVETATDNTTRTVANVRAAFNKCNGSLSTSGSVEFMFEHKCHFKLPSENLDPEELELEMIDFGVEEIILDEEENAIFLYAPFEEFGNISKEIDSKGIEIIESGFDRIPMDLKEMSESDQTDVDKLLERLEEDDDVQNVFHNMAE